MFYDIHLHSFTDSGLWLHGENTYLQVEEGQEIPLTENRIIVCVSSKGVVNFANWYFFGEDATGEGELVSFFS